MTWRWPRLAVAAESASASISHCGRCHSVRSTAELPVCRHQFGDLVAGQLSAVSVETLVTERAGCPLFGRGVTKLVLLVAQVTDELEILGVTIQPKIPHFQGIPTKTHTYHRPRCVALLALRLSLTLRESRSAANAALLEPLFGFAVRHESDIAVMTYHVETRPSKGDTT